MRGRLRWSNAHELGMALMPVTPLLSRFKTYRLDSIQPDPSDQKESQRQTI